MGCKRSKEGGKRSKERHGDLVLSVIPKYLLVSVSTFFFASNFGIIGMMMAK